MGFIIGLGGCVKQLLSIASLILNLPQNCFHGKIFEIGRESMVCVIMDPNTACGSVPSAGWGGKQSRGIQPNRNGIYPGAQDTRTPKLCRAILS